MNTINLTFEKYQNLKPFIINTKHIEGNFFYYKGELLKSFLYKTLKDSFLNDKYINLLTLEKYEETLKNIEELLLPTSIIKVNDKFIGYTRPLYENAKTYHQILQDPKVSFNTKIKLLTTLGKILEKLENVTNDKIHIGDLHESNILLTSDFQTKIIDIDSFSLNNGIYFPSKYIVECLILDDFKEKYKILKKKDQIKKVYYTKNTDLYCYIIIILNTLANFKMHKLLETEFFDYIDYLETIGLPYEFLSTISKIYSTSDNINPYPLLETLPLEKLSDANHLVYTKKTGKPIIYI